MQALVKVRLLVQAAPKRMLYPSYRCFAYKATKNRVETASEDSMDHHAPKLTEVQQLNARLPEGFRPNKQASLEKGQYHGHTAPNDNRRTRFRVDNGNPNKI
eukprot:Platyproteum_vivax@DN7634_c1_g6_i1.p1